MNEFNIKKLSGLFYVLGVLLLVFITVKLIGFLFPFILAYFIVSIVKPLSEYISYELKTNSLKIKMLCLTLFYLLIGSLIFIIVYKIIIEGYKFSAYLIDKQDYIIQAINGNIDNITKNLDFIPGSLLANTTEFTSKIVNITSQTLNSVFLKGINIITNLPKMLMATIMMILSSFVLIKDDGEILKYIEKQFPNSWIRKVKEVKEGILSLILVYIKAQLKLMTITFFELIVGLIIIDLFVSPIEYILFYAFVICLTDSLPLFGAGAILAPWAILNLFNGNYIMSISLIVLSVSIWSTRQFIEPKLISKGVETHPLITLISMYSGFKLFGLFGLLIGPLVLIVFRIIFNKQLEIGFFKFVVNDFEEKDEKSS